MVAAKESRIRILTVDDHPMLREGVVSLVRRQGDMEVVGEAETGAQALEAFNTLRPDVTLIDLKLPDMSGIRVVAQLHEAEPQAKFVVLTTYSRDMEVVRALKAGASAYLLKTSLRKELLTTIRAVYAGRRYLSAEIAYKIALHSNDELLSDREIDILMNVAGGHGNKEIARRLSISEETVKTHMKSVFAKLNVTDRTRAVTIAAERGLIDLW
jgi:DNA-binding NarL/FixJ family response regulator